MPITEWLRLPTARHLTSPGKNVANPLSLILSAAMLLAWYGRRRKANPFETTAAGAIEKAVEAAIAAKETTTDIGGKLGTRETGEAVAARLRAMTANPLRQSRPCRRSADHYPQVADRTYLADIATLKHLERVSATRETSGGL